LAAMGVPQRVKTGAAESCVAGHSGDCPPDAAGPEVIAAGVSEHHVQIVPVSTPESTPVVLLPLAVRFKASMAESGRCTVRDCRFLVDFRVSSEAAKLIAARILTTPARAS
jgi:hypothetical protein